MYIVIAKINLVDIGGLTCEIQINHASAGKTGWALRSKIIAKRLHRQWPIQAGRQRFRKMYNRHDGLLEIEVNGRQGLLFKRDFVY